MLKYSRNLFWSSSKSLRVAVDSWLDVGLWLAALFVVEELFAAQCLSAVLESEELDECLNLLLELTQEHHCLFQL